MNPLIVTPKLQAFLAEHESDDLVALLLKKPFFKGVTQQELAQQIEARKKCKDKLPTWYHTPNLYYPNKLQIAQTSAEAAARYKANLVNGKAMVDITGGLGVDTFYFSQKVNTVYHCEINCELSDIANYNFKVLGQHNITCLAQEGIGFLKTSSQNFDWVYVDPSRRDKHANRVFRLEDSQPNLPEHLPVIFKKTRNVLIKAAPLLDITQGIRELQHVKEIHVVALRDEVKELLFVLECDYIGEIMIKTINIVKDQKHCFEFTQREEEAIAVAYSEPQKYLYEPNAAILKSGGFKSVGDAFGVEKLHPHSHLYTADVLVDFPGRRFKVIAVKPYTKATMRSFDLIQANITVRNFPLSVAALRKKHKIKDGGEHYLFFTTTVHDKKVLLQCAKC